MAFSRTAWIQIFIFGEEEYSKTDTSSLPKVHFLLFLSQKKTSWIKNCCINVPNCSFLLLELVALL